MTAEDNPAKAAGVPVLSKIESVNGVRVNTKTDVVAALKTVPAGAAAEFGAQLCRAAG